MAKSSMIVAAAQFEVATASNTAVQWIDEFDGSAVGSPMQLPFGTMVLCSEASIKRNGAKLRIAKGSLLYVQSWSNGVLIELPAVAQEAIPVSRVNAADAAKKRVKPATTSFKHNVHAWILHPSSSPNQVIRLNFTAVSGGSTFDDPFQCITGGFLPPGSIVRIVLDRSNQSNSGQLVETAGLVEVTEVVQ